MAGLAGLAGWQWIFILEGLVTAVAGMIAVFFIHNGPDSVSWLTEEERRYLKLRLSYDGNRHGMGQSEDGSKREYIKQAFMSPQVSTFQPRTILLSTHAQTGLLRRHDLHGHRCGDLWPGIRTAHNHLDVSKYRLIYIIFEASLNIDFRQGYTNRVAQLMTVPPYVTASILTIVVAHCSDRLKQRGIFIFGSLFLSAIGFSMAIATSDKPNMAGVTYAGCFLASCGFYPALPGCISWMANNVAGPYKRAIGLSLQIGNLSPLDQSSRTCRANSEVSAIGNLGGIIGSNIYLAREKPAYHTGYGISMGFIGIALIAVVWQYFFLIGQNKKRERYIRENGGVEGVVEKHGDVTLTEMGDRSYLFHYTL